MKAKFELADRDQYRLDEAYGRLAQAQEQIDILGELMAVKARNVELEAWYKDYIDRAVGRINHDLNFSLVALKAIQR